MSDSINVNAQELIEIKNNIERNGNELINTMKKIIQNTELTKDCFDSLTGDEFRKELIDYLNGRIAFVENSYLTLSNKLAEAISDYTEFYDSVQEMVGDVK